MADIKYGRKVYRGIDKITFRDADDPTEIVEFKEAQSELPKNGKDVIFYDYDGSIWVAYNKNDFLELSVLPPNPTHDGLISQGWNWSLADAKTYVASYGKLNIGQMYATASGKTEYDIEVNEATGFTITLNNSNKKDWGDGTVNTLKSHTYTTTGNYTIKLDGTIIVATDARNCKQLRSVRIANGVTDIGVEAFRGCSLLHSITIPNTVVRLFHTTFQGCYSLQSITIPSSMTHIGSMAFQGCSSLQSVIIPLSMTSTDGWVFESCYSLQSVAISSSMMYIQGYEFNNCHSLQSVSIPLGVTSIGNSAFGNCYSLQSIIIPSSITNIGTSAFTGCSWLTIMTIRASTPPVLAAANAIPSNVKKIEIPRGSLAAYESETNWCEHAGKYVEVDFDD